MNQIHFTKVNKTRALKGQAPVPAFVDEESGLVVTCWHLSFKERLKMLFGGRIFLCAISGRKVVPVTMLKLREKEIFDE